MTKYSPDQDHAHDPVWKAASSTPLGYREMGRRSNSVSVCYQWVCLSVPYVKLLPEEFVVISHATVHFFLQLVNRKGRVLPVCAGRTGQ